VQNNDIMDKFKRYTITSALPYANGPLHIGHLAGVYVPADIYARYLRLNNKEVLFIGGSDEHGVPIMIKAMQEGKKPQEIVDHYHEMIKKSFEEFDISFDIYSRTSSPTHHAMAADFFKNLYDKNIFSVQSIEQWYDEESQMFLADRYIKGICPKCSYTEAHGDQCEKCGTSLSPMELIDPVSVLSGKKPVLKKTKHWYLPLDKYQDWLKEWIIKGKKGIWKSNVYGQCSSWINEGLRPRAVTRDLNWGVPVPLEEAQGKVLYVWFDAPIGYISATKEYSADWEKWWKDKESRLIHFIGKDNIVFHCIMFPVMLKAESSYILPDNVPANEFLNLEGQKISTSKNWAVWLHEYLADFPGKQDVLRYVLTANAPENKDNDFTWKDFQAKNNNELLAILGNFINRVLVLTQKYFQGIVPEYHSLEDLKQIDIPAFAQKVEAAIEQFRFREAQQEMMNLARAGNKYLTDKEPWKIFKSNPEEVKNILYTCLQISANLAIMMHPFLPFSSKKTLQLLNLDAGLLQWQNIAKKELLPSGHTIAETTLLFEKIEDEIIETQISKLKNNDPQEESTDFIPLKEEILFEDFQKMDIRIARVIEAEKVEKTDKLMKLKLDLGFEQRTVVSGIAHQYKAEDLISRQVVYLANLKSRKLRGIDSQGMILMIQEKNDVLKFLKPDTEAESGAPIG
jgi:methionyl-tRNA synthetase